MRMPSGPLTNAVLAVTVVAWLALLLTGWQDYAIVAGGFIPARLSGLVDLAGAVPAWLTPLSSALLHASLMHLAFNGLMLLFCGRHVEWAIGAPMMALLYLVGAYVSAATHYLVDPASMVPVVGARGAISALVGSSALLSSRQRITSKFGIPPVVLHVAWLAAAWIVLQLVFGYAFRLEGMGIAIWSHIGGFAAGLVLAVPMLRWRQRRLARAAAEASPQP